MQKNSPIASKKIRQSAKGEDCTLNMSGICNYSSDTTVLCHFPSDVAGYKSTDLSAGYGCSKCHDVLDGRVKISYMTEADKDFYMRRSQTRTLHRLIDKGIIKIA